MTRTAYVANHSITWAAQQLVDQHGSEARFMALANAQKMAEEGRMELNAMWEMVQGAVGELLGDAAPDAPVLH
jgi:translation initiation factor IF-3